MPRSIKYRKLQKPESLIDEFYIDECTARSNQSGEFKVLVQNSCNVNETDIVLDRVKPILSQNGRKLQFKQFAFDEVVCDSGYTLTQQDNGFVCLTALSETSTHEQWIPSGGNGVCAQYDSWPFAIGFYDYFFPSYLNFVKAQNLRRKYKFFIFVNIVTNLGSIKYY